jgi:hypothetical protein
MEWKNTLSFLLVFLIAFSLGYLIDVPNEIDINFNVDERFVEATENMENLTYNCPKCECVCKTSSFYNGRDTTTKYYNLTNKE